MGAARRIVVSTGTRATANAGKESVFSPAYRSITISALVLLSLAAFDGMAVAAALP